MLSGRRYLRVIVVPSECRGRVGEGARQTTARGVQRQVAAAVQYQSNRCPTTQLELAEMGATKGPRNRKRREHQLATFVARAANSIRLERAMGLEPTTSSLGSGTKLMGALRNALSINAVRPACFSVRQDISAYSSPNGNQR